MQNILTIDATEQVLLAAVFSLNGRELSLIEEREIRLPEMLLPLRKGLHEGTELKEGGALADDSSNDTDHFTAGEVNGTTQDPLVSKLTELLQGITHSYDSAVLIIPPFDYLSLNLELPFYDSSNINRILDLEIQDLVPFDVSEFHFSHLVVHSESPSQNEVHVSLLPKKHIQSILSLCKSCGLEPLVLTTPTCFASPLYHLAELPLEENAAVVVKSGDFLAVAAVIAGKVRTDRVLKLSDDSLKEGNTKLLKELKVTLAAIEQQYNLQLQRIYLLESPFSAQEIQLAVGRAVSVISPEELVQGAKGRSALCGLAAILTSDTNAPPAIPNFRCREFSYSPQLKELKNAALKALPYLAGLFLLALVVISSLYLSRNHHISTLQQTMQKEVSQIAPHLDISKGREVVTVQDETSEIEQRVQQLGTNLRYTPLQALAHISKDVSPFLARSTETEVSKLVISAGRISLTINVPDYTAAESIEQVLKQKNRRSIYCNVRQPSSPSTHGSVSTRRAQFEIRLCD